MTNLLLSHGPKLEATDADFQGTPLGWAIYGSKHGWHSQTGDHAATVEALILAGANRPSSINGSQAVQEVLRLAAG